jgi:hypothetical protein
MADYAASYCERCGTRYTFGSSPSAGSSLKDARVLAKGLKYFVLSNSASMGEAMAYARNDLQSSESLRVTEQFHKTFNFCMTCRQYACDSCWNEAQSACLSCTPESAIQPVEPTDLLPVRTQDSKLEPDPSGSAPRAGDVLGSTSTPPAIPAWPMQDIPIANAALADVNEATTGAASDAESARQANRSLWPIQDDLDAARLDLTPEELALVEGQLEHMAPHMLADSTDGPSTAEEAAATLSQVEPSLVSADAAPASSTEREPAATPRADRIKDDAEPIRAESLVEGNVGPWPDATPWSVRPVESREPVLGPTAAEQSGPAAEAQAEQLAPAPDFPAGSQAPVPGSPESQTPARKATAGLLAGSDSPTPAEMPAAPISSMEPSPEPEFTTEPELASQPKSPSLPQWPGLPDWQSDTTWQSHSDTADARDWTARAEEATEPVSGSVAEAPGDASPIESQPTEPVVAASVQQPLFDMPTASANRQAAAPRAPETDASRPSSDLPAWQPIGASWPAPEAPHAPWPGPQPSAVPAAIVAAQQADRPAGPAIWAASSQEVMSHGNVRACHQCALPVSTHARYCRRCGAQQA